MSNWNETYYFPKEILEQADAIQNCLNDLQNDIRQICIKHKEIEKIQIVGSGDCYYITFAAMEAFKKIAGINAQGFEAYDYYLNEPEVNEKTLVILLSSSGKSLYLLKSAEYAVQAGGVTVGVTNHDDSPLGTMCTVSLVTKAIGVSRSFPSKTTTSALAIMYQMAYEMGRINKVQSEEKYKRLSDELSTEVPAMIRKVYENEHEKLTLASQMFFDASSYMFVGSGPCRSTAFVGAAKIVETSRKHVTFCNAEEYLHLHGFSVRSSDVVTVISNNISSHRETQVVEYARNQCARILVVGDISIGNRSENILQIGEFLKSLSPFGIALVSMVVLHLFACELSKKANIDPDLPHGVDIKHVISLLYTGPVAGWQV